MRVEVLETMAVQDESWKRTREVIMHTLKLVRKGQFDKVFAALDSAIAEVPEDHRRLEGFFCCDTPPFLPRLMEKETAK